MALGSALPVSAKFLPRVRLTQADVAELSALADESVRETLLSYEEYLYGQNRQLDMKRWKIVKENEAVKVYRERESAPHANARDRKATVEIGPKASLAASTRMPLMLVHGTVQGTIEDALYGSYADDTSSMRRRSMYEKDLMEDSAVVASLESPTLEAPFQQSYLSWLLRDFPGLNAVIRRRDFLLVNKMGVTTTSRGERIGYQLEHSVEHRDLPELTQAGIVRGKYSHCLVLRQLDPSRIELFNQTVVDPGGSLMSYIAIQESAESLLSCGHMMASSQKKKLFYFMRKQARANALSSSRANGTRLSNASLSPGASVLARHQSMDRDVSDRCASCEKSISKLFSSGGVCCQICQQVRLRLVACVCVLLYRPWVSDKLRLPSPPSLCRLTCQIICSRCSLKKKIVIEATEKKVVLKPFVFCLACTIRATKFSAEQVQVEELRERQLSL
ncbi:hypothetical protein PybrP1_003583 [[Pythium] brassicae (nom. inval.)]|nr:hypothetical protein PybrP1_003583 [[Pythium] brassicae (nom. inval.)]